MGPDQRSPRNAVRPPAELSMQGALIAKYEPHWLWAVCVVLVPVVLTALGFLGIWPSSGIALSVASFGPRAAVVIGLCGLAAAVITRRRTAIALAVVGLALSAAGYGLLLWLA